jgi:hypothetical protein
MLVEGLQLLQDVGFGHAFANVFSAERARSDPPPEVAQVDASLVAPDGYVAGAA